MENVPVLNKGEGCLNLPPGFRFHPTDEEIITHYLTPKVLNPSFSATAIGDVDLNKSEPWDLPSKAKMGEKEWYFFCQRDRKYPTGTRTNRATEAGYWKATGKDKMVFRGKGQVLVGMKKTLVFYKGRAPKGEKSNWVMHEFRLEGKSNLPRSAKEEWAVCRVFHKNTGMKNCFGEDFIQHSPSLPPLTDQPYFDPNNHRLNSSYVDDIEALGYKGIPSISNSMPSYFTAMAGMEDSQGPYFSLPGPADSAYLLPEQALLKALAAANDASPLARRHCKVEQCSNQSMVSASQDTADISSVISKQEIGSCRSYDDLGDPSSVEPVIDFENMWKY